MNRFNDIINEDKVLEIPQYLNKIEDYGSIIKGAFALTDGLLNMDDIVIVEDDRHIRITITSKNIQTRFNLNYLENNRIDQKDLIRGLNKALTDIFYLGTERFYSLNGKVLPSAIGFISNRQKRHLMKEGLIGNVNEELNVEKPITNKKPEVIKEEKPHVESKESKPENKPVSDKKAYIEIKNKIDYIEEKLKNENSITIFNIIHHPDKHSKEIVEKAKIIALSKDIPIFDKREYEEAFNRLEVIINKIIESAMNNYSSGTIHKILEEFDLDRKDKFLVLAEARRKVKEIEKSGKWKKILKIILFILSLLFFLSKL